MNAKSYLIDTSVLVRFLSEEDVYHPMVKSAVAKLASSASPLIFTPQVVRECWVVLTRPKTVNGFGLDLVSALKAVELTSREFSFLADSPDVYLRWLDLLSTTEVSGKQVHDAYHVAAMKAHGITKILTLAKRDFARYADIEVVFPERVL